MKSAFVAIIGRPSAGKSTLLNALCGKKVSIVSSTPQTTRNKIRGIVNKAGLGQIVFLDTPGIHMSEKKFNNAMMANVSSSLEDADVVLYLLDGSRAPGAEERHIVSMLKTSSKPLVVAVNKSDLGSPASQEIKELIQQELKPIAQLSLSALEKKGLEPLLLELFEASPEGPAYYPEEYYTDQDPEFRASEIIREKAVNLTKEEVPHALYVEIADMEYNEEEDRLWIRAFLTVERETQVGIVVGHQGERIKIIRQSAQKELAKIFERKIHLDLRVKVNAKWRTKDHLVKKILGEGRKE